MASNLCQEQLEALRQSTDPGDVIGEAVGYSTNNSTSHTEILLATDGQAVAVPPMPTTTFTFPVCLLQLLPGASIVPS